MHCPACLAEDTKVVDSRLAEEGAAIRRRRECLACSHRFTTFERVDEVPLVVAKSDGRQQGRLLYRIRRARGIELHGEPVTSEQGLRLGEARGRTAVDRLFNQPVNGVG